MIHKLVVLFIAGTIRYFILISKYSLVIRNRIEVSTPLNSWKRVHEGVFLYNSGVDPYSGDLYHQNPLILFISNVLINRIPHLIPIVFVFLDLLTAILLYFMAKKFISQEFKHEEDNRQSFAAETEELQLQTEDLITIPVFVAMAYLFNPYTVLNCIGQTTTVFSNLLLASFFWSLVYRQKLATCIFLALETQMNFYPFVLIVPAALILSNGKRSKLIECFILFGIVFFGVNYLAFSIVQSWNFLYSTYGFILNHGDLQPNIGLFWYFFAEMFEHFRTLFLFTFQMNATILYLIPLTIKLQKQPMILATILAALITVFRSYPCVGDLAFYLSLVPLWKRSSKFMANNFIVFCFFLVTSALAPTVWYLWIYCNSANANFYFGATLAFASAQIFLITDLMFATNKREFCLKNGLYTLTKIVLE